MGEHRHEDTWKQYHDAQLVTPECGLERHIDGDYRSPLQRAFEF